MIRVNILTKFLLVCFFSFFSFQFSACAESFQEGKDYQVIPHQSSIPSFADDSVTVTEFFSYGCPWCYEFEPQLVKWLRNKPANVNFNRIPVVFEKYWDLYAKAYYISVALGMEKKMTPKLFYAIQEQNKTLGSESAMEDFFIHAGIKKNIATQAFEESPTLDNEIKQGLQLMQAYQVYVIPTIIVDGKYRVDLQMATDEKRFIAIMQFLIEKTKQEKKIK